VSRLEPSQTAATGACQSKRRSSTAVWNVTDHFVAGWSNQRRDTDPVSESELALVPADEVHTLLDGNITRHPKTHFLDFVFDGRSLREMVDGGPDQVTELCRPRLHAVGESVARLLGRLGTEGLSENRVALLVCGVCGDLGCGAVTARLNVSQDQVSWSEFRWESGVGGPTAIDVKDQIDGRIVFSRAAYEAMLKSAYERIAAMPHDEPEHRGRRLLWPWQWGWRIPKPTMSRAGRVLLAPVATLLMSTVPVAQTSPVPQLSDRGHGHNGTD